MQASAVRIEDGILRHRPSSRKFVLGAGGQGGVNGAVGCKTSARFGLVKGGFNPQRRQQRDKSAGYRMSRLQRFGSSTTTSLLEMLTRACGCRQTPARHQDGMQARGIRGQVVGVPKTLYISTREKATTLRRPSCPGARLASHASLCAINKSPSSSGDRGAPAASHKRYQTRAERRPHLGAGAQRREPANEKEMPARMGSRSPVNGVQPRRLDHCAVAPFRSCSKPAMCHPAASAPASARPPH